MAAAILPQGAGPEVTIRPLGPKPSLFIDPAVPAGRSRKSLRHSFRRSRNGCRRAACACRVSTNCRCRRKTKFAPAAANSRRSIPKSGAHRCCSGWRQWVSGRREGGRGSSGPSARARARDRQAGRNRSPERLTAAGRSPRPESRPEPVSEYAKRSAPQGLDQHGRQAPVHNRSEEDQLDIPAFLRRQAN